MKEVIDEKKKEEEKYVACRADSQHLLHKTNSFRLVGPCFLLFTWWSRRNNCTRQKQQSCHAGINPTAGENSHARGTLPMPNLRIPLNRSCQNCDHLSPPVLEPKKPQLGKCATGKHDAGSSQTLGSGFVALMLMKFCWTQPAMPGNANVA